MEVGLVQKIDIDQEMQQSYLDYAMSVIVSRALPDARDGLKPVHRRILYAMYDMGIRPNTSYKKSARIVGEVLGKYHPHGDMAVYDAMARMAQDFSMRLQLVDGQGNFGSVDGDPPAAMRYTEARMAAPAGDMLADIEKSTVDFIDNFDGTLTEPAVLPAALPNLLVNGATGIAVGMSTSIPPHNLTEVAAALQYMLEHWDKLDDIGLEDIMKFIQGPDFPTGGVIIQEADGESLASAYASGRGRITLQARAHVEEMDRGRQRIIVTELPYMTNKSNLIERIANLAREERIEGISDLRDESDRNGMRIVIELSRNTNPDEVLRNLYKSTPMRSTFSLIMLALVDGEPRMLGLKQCLRVYLEHRQEIIRRRSEHELGKARQRVHILDGLLTALNNLDEVIDIIRRSRTVESARANLERKFKLSEIQTTAILDMPLRRLAALERKKIEEEHAELVKRIKELESLLRSPKKMRALIASELAAVTGAYEDPRRTQIVLLKEGEVKASVLRASDLAPDTTVWVTVDADGRMARTPDDKPPRPSGRDVPVLMVKANTRDTLYMVAEDGETAALLLTSLPEADMPSEGSFFHRLSALSSEQRLAAVFSLPPKSEQPAEGWYVLTISDQGMVKRSDLNELPGPSAGTFALTRINDGDRLLGVRLTQGDSEVLLATRSGMAIRFKEEEVRPMGLVAAGVMGIKLQGDDRLVGAELLPSNDDVFFIASDGSAKRVAPNQFPQQGRYGQGVQAWKLPRKVEVVGMTIGRGTLRVTVHLKLLAAKSARLDEAPKLGRSARGNVILEMKDGDEVTGLSTPLEPPRPRGARPASPPPAAASAKASARKPKARASSRSKSGSTPKKRTPKGGAKKPRAK